MYFSIKILIWIRLSHCDFSFPQSSVNVPRIWKPASLCPDCSYANDAFFNFCQHCGFQPAPPSVSARTSRVSLDLPAIDCRISSLQSVRAAKPYEKQKCSLHFELESFLSSLPTPKSTISASLKGVIRFLVWKDSMGKTKIHSLNCLISALTLNGSVAAPLD